MIRGIFMKIAMLEAASVSRGDVSFDDIYKLGEVREFPLTPVDRIIENIGDAEAVLCNKTPFTAEIMESCPNLRYIGLCATGFNNVDLEAASRLGIVVTNVPAYSDMAVAQQVFAYILRCCNKTGDYDRFVKDGGWVRSPSFSAFEFPTVELDQKVLGIIGYGRIGHAVSRIARAFGMKVLVHTRTVRDEADVEFVPLDELLSRSDFITLHCPLTPETDGLVDIDFLKKCKPTAMLINTSRGAVVNENDLRYALDNDIIAAAGLDVLVKEPMSAENVLLDSDKCMITPHIAWSPIDTRRRLMKVVAENLAAFIAGKPINKVN